jgi:hypothetical protein
MPNIQNSISLIKRSLIQNSDITDIVSDRIYSSHFYDLDNSTIEYPMIIVDYDGGRAGYGKSHQIVNIHIYVYSKYNTDQCLEIYETIYETLQGKGLGNPNVNDKGYIRENIRPVNGYNSKTMSYYCMAEYLLITSG